MYTRDEEEFLKPSRKRKQSTDFQQGTENQDVYLLRRFKTLEEIAVDLEIHLQYECKMLACSGSPWSKN